MATDGPHRGVWNWVRRRRAHLGMTAIGMALAWFGYDSYRAVERDLSEAALSGRSSVAVLAASTLTQEFQRLIDIGRLLASRVRFTGLIIEGRWPEAAQRLDKVSRDFPTIEQVLLLDAQGIFQAATPPVDSWISRSGCSAGWCCVSARTVF